MQGESENRITGKNGGSSLTISDDQALADFVFSVVCQEILFISVTIDLN